MSAVLQRPLRGSRISTFYPVKNLPSLSSLDSAFQLQEYISLLIRLNVHDVEAITSLPGVPATDKEKAKETNEQDADKAGSSKDAAGDKDSAEKGRGSSGASAEVTVDEACWIYEQIRRLAQDLSHPLITTLQQECTRSSCPEMKAGEWLYLCVAHGNDGSMEHCCAIDYILHTVDSATALLNSPRTFPSRLQIPSASHRHFSALARRLGRIFAHAYFHHREAFEQAEAESSLYARFLALTSKFDLVPAEFLVIPPTHATDDHIDPPRTLGPPHGNERFGPGYVPGLPGGRNDEHEYFRNITQRSGTFNQGQGKLHHTLEPHHQPPPLTREVGGSGLSGTNLGTSGGIGESPVPLSRSKLGRSRTDTMVFSEADAATVAEHLRSPGGASKGVDADGSLETVPKVDVDAPVDPSDDGSKAVEGSGKDSEKVETSKQPPVAPAEEGPTHPVEDDVLLDGEEDEDDVDDDDEDGIEPVDLDEDDEEEAANAQHASEPTHPEPVEDSSKPETKIPEVVVEPPPAQEDAPSHPDPISAPIELTPAPENVAEKEPDVVESSTTPAPASVEVETAPAPPATTPSAAKGVVDVASASDHKPEEQEQETEGAKVEAVDVPLPVALEGELSAEEPVVAAATTSDAKEEGTTVKQDAEVGDAKDVKGDDAAVEEDDSKDKDTKDSEDKKPEVEA